MNTDLLFFETGIQNYGSHLKGIFIFFFYQLLEKENLFPQYYVLGLKMTFQWKSPLEGSIFKFPPYGPSLRRLIAYY